MGGHSGGPIAGIAGRERECRELDARFLMPCGVVRVPRWFCGATLGWARQPCSSTRCALPPTCGPCGLSVSSRTVGSASGRYTGCLSRSWIASGPFRIVSATRSGLRVSWTAPRRGPSVFGRVGNSDGVFGGSCRAGASVPGDDVQWIDRESFDVLGLVARRLLLEGLPGLDIAGLDEHPGFGRR